MSVAMVAFKLASCDASLAGMRETAAASRADMAEQKMPHGRTAEILAGRWVSWRVRCLSRIPPGQPPAQS